MLFLNFLFYLYSTQEKYGKEKTPNDARIGLPNTGWKINLVGSKDELLHHVYNRMLQEDSAFPNLISTDWVYDTMTIIHNNKGPDRNPQTVDQFGTSNISKTRVRVIYNGGKEVFYNFGSFFRSGSSKPTHGLNTTFAGDYTDFPNFYNMGFPQTKQAESDQLIFYKIVMDDIFSTFNNFCTQKGINIGTGIECILIETASFYDPCYSCTNMLNYILETGQVRKHIINRLEHYGIKFTENCKIILHFLSVAANGNRNLLPIQDYQERGKNEPLGVNFHAASNKYLSCYKVINLNVKEET